MSKTLSLMPPELLSDIARQVAIAEAHTKRSRDAQHSDSAALALVCRKLKSAAQEQIYRSINVRDLNSFYDLHGSPFREGGGKLLQLEKAGKLHLVRELSIQTLEYDDLSFLVDIAAREHHEMNFLLPPSRQDRNYPPLHQIIDFLVRLPNLNQIFINCLPFSTIPSNDLNRLRTPFANITSLKIATPPWDRDHSILRQITQLTPELSTLTLLRYFDPTSDSIHYRCSAPLPIIPKLNHLKLEGAFYLNIASLNLISPEQASTITRLSFSDRDDLLIDVAVPLDFGEKLGEFFGKSVRHLEWFDSGVYTEHRYQAATGQLEAMFGSFENVESITSDYLCWTNEWILSFAPPSLKTINFEIPLEGLDDTVFGIIEIFDEAEDMGRYENLKGKVIRLRGMQNQQGSFDCMWTRFAHWGIGIEFTELAKED